MRGLVKPCEYACTTTLDHPTPGYCGAPSDGHSPPRCPSHRAAEADAPDLLVSAWENAKRDVANISERNRRIFDANDALRRATEGRDGR